MDAPIMMDCSVPMWEEFMERMPWALLAFLGVAVAAYFLGCSNGAVIISKYILRDDVRTHGSGNAGLTNFHRVFGGPLTLAVILIDVLKAVAALLLSVFVFRSIFSGGWHQWQFIALSKYWAGLFCLLGHMFPCMFGFKGGKGILSGGTIAIMIGMGAGPALPAWIIPVTVWGGFLILTALTRWVSLGSCWAGASFPFVTWFVYHDWIILILAAIIGGLILWKHRANIGRLIRGEESKLTFHKKK